VNVTSKYRIEAVEIAGFKAFTTPQRVPINGKTTFIFGENSLGKSSIIEAVVWCLYGTETGVRNQLYQGPCFVNLYLMESGDSSKISRIQRRMHQADNESDVDVYSPDGSRKNITDFIPQLKKLEHGPGTRVIFAEQEPGRRYSHDLNNFEELIAAYLELDIAYSLIGWLVKFIENQETTFNNQVRSKEKEISDGIQKTCQIVYERIKMITGQPPWDSKFPPSEIETLEKVRSFLGNISSLLGEDNVAVTSTDLEELLTLGSSKLNELENSSKTSLEANVKALENRQETASELRNQLYDVIQQVKNLE
jgi:DNA repair exonuclease SbcCD ATPase subunit